jgi:hypothetical protein
MQVREAQAHHHHRNLSHPLSSLFVAVSLSFRLLLFLFRIVVLVFALVSALSLS